jgi:hypothetical protein
MIGKLLRKPYSSQILAIMGLVRRWQQARAGAVIAECGTGKTLISLGAIQTHAENRPFAALAMVPPQLVEKWCREAMLVPTTINWPFGQLMVPKEDGQDMLPEPFSGASEDHRVYEMVESGSRATVW